MPLSSSLTPGSKQAVSAGKPKNITHSRFEPNPKSLGTYRFGEITPHFAFELLDNDTDIVLRCMHKLRTLPLQSPVLNATKLHKAYFNVPMQAILPFNYDKWRTIPVSGDDCPADAGTTVTDFENKVRIFFTNFIANMATYGNTANDLWFMFTYMALIQWFSSEGSLLHSLGIRNASDFVYSSSARDFDGDELVDFLFDKIQQQVPAGDLLFYWDNYSVINAQIYDTDDDNTNNTNISLREFWNRFLQQPVNSFVPATVNPLDTQIVFDGVETGFTAVAPSLKSGNYQIPIDLRRVHAYNLVCAHFFSNDHIDYIYSAELYRQNQYALIKLCGYDSAMRFTMNGVPYEYDALSAKAVDLMLLTNLSANYVHVIAYFANMFNFNRSLRFMDYFTGSRKQPLAIGSNNVPVTGGNVSVLDITKSIQFQRLRNFANRVGPKFKSFLDGFFGKSPAYDYHEPFFIADTEEDLFANEVENTGANQSSNSNFITSNIKSVNDKYAFNFDSDRDSVLIGVSYFDIVRFYPFGVPRIVQHVDKFDDFLPDLQFIGDQSIECSEIGSFLQSGQIFGYTTRNQEYKVSTPFCFGGIRKALKTWSFTFPNIKGNTVISPDFIRSQQSEFDKFYSQLSGFSYRSYFHFIVLNNNELSLSRPMTKNPQIL